MSDEPRPRKSSIEAIARDLDVPVDALMAALSELFEGIESPEDLGDAVGLSVSAVFSEDVILSLPADIQDYVRAKEAKRAATRSQILDCIAQSLGHPEGFATAADEVRIETEALADSAIRSWEWGPELDHPGGGGPPIKTELQRLLHEHYELGADVHAFVDAALYPEDDEGTP
jgi:hypothetical protein